MRDDLKTRFGRKGYQVFVVCTILIIINIFVNYRYQYMPNRYTWILMFVLYATLWLFNAMKAWRQSR